MSILADELIDFFVQVWILHNGMCDRSREEFHISRRVIDTFRQQTVKSHSVGHVMIEILTAQGKHPLVCDDLRGNSSARQLFGFVQRLFPRPASRMT